MKHVKITIFNHPHQCWCVCRRSKWRQKKHASIVCAPGYIVGDLKRLDFKTSREPGFSNLIPRSLGCLTRSDWIQRSGCPMWLVLKLLGGRSLFSDGAEGLWTPGSHVSTPVLEVSSEPGLPRSETPLQPRTVHKERSTDAGEDSIFGLSLWSWMMWVFPKQAPSPLHPPHRPLTTPDPSNWPWVRGGGHVG